MIDKKLILSNAPTELNELVHINHKDCPAGTDTKRRLYIRRKPDGLVAYCHHCNEKGFVRDTTYRLRNWLDKSPSSTPSSYRMPVLDNDISIEGKKWLSKYHCYWTNNSDYFRGVVDEPNRIALMLRDPESTNIGIQVRNLLPNSPPKYISHFYSQANKGSGSWFCENENNLVITEDYLSAYRINLDTGVSSVALLRTSLSDLVLQQICELNFKKIYIWLDPDEAGRDGTRKVLNKLKYFLSHVWIGTIMVHKEPKQCTKDELDGFLGASPVFSK